MGTNRRNSDLDEPQVENQIEFGEELKTAEVEPGYRMFASKRRRVIQIEQDTCTEQ
jgi:hypothetical protein